ncbi:MAG: hypothetical protein ACYDAR_02825 [Thermomicrobiales bacterium]
MSVSPEHDTDTDGEAVREPTAADVMWLDALASHAEREYRAGRTRLLRDIAAIEGVTVDERA